MNLTSFIRVYDDALPAADCARIRAHWDALAAHQQTNGAEVNPTLHQSRWTELDLAYTRDAELSTRLSAHVHHAYTRYNQEVPSSLPLSPPTRTDRWIVKRYRQQGLTPTSTPEQFQPHFDAVGPAANRYLVLLWYLNDVADGGETVFPDLDLRIAPRRGRLLVFPPYWMFAHAGQPSLSGDKYIMSTYLMY